MPVVMFQVPEAVSSDEAAQSITRAACELLGQVLEAPSDRIRAYMTTLPNTHVCAGGDVVSASGVPAPFYQFFVLADRSAVQVSALHEGFAALLAEHLKIDRSIIRGTCIRISPDDWAIAGKPASEIRKAELDKRKEEAS